MAKRKDSAARERRKEQLANAYSAVCAKYKFDENTDAITQARIVIRDGVKLLIKINDETNAIIESDYSEVKDVLGLPLSKAQYKECVDIMSKIQSGEYTEKNREKYAEGVEQKRYDGMLRETFLDSVINEEKDDFPLPVTDTDKIGDVVKKSMEAENDGEFGEIFRRSVSRIMNVKESLQVDFNILSDAFVYITNENYTKRDFRKLVEWEYFEAGVPSENSAPKLWTDIYKAWETLRLAGTFRQSDLGDIMREFNFTAEIDEPHPYDEHRSWWKKPHWDLFTRKDEDSEDND